MIVLVRVPARLRLLRRRGFNLQSVSMAANSRSAEVVTRPHSVFKNRWIIGTHSNRLGRDVASAAEAVECFRLLSGWATEPHKIAYTKERLHGKNLACWCKLCPAHAVAGRPFNVPCSACAPCHADVLLEIANG